jgi:mono/diheme cytochrome c family protein
VLTAVSSVIAPVGTPIAAQEREALVARGKALFVKKGCHGCHTISKVGTRLGPDLTRVGGRYREEDLRRWLSPPVPELTQGERAHESDPVEHEGRRDGPHMPTPNLSESEAQALVAYLASLR